MKKVHNAQEYEKKPQRKRTAGDIIRTVLIIVFSAVFIISASYLVRYMLESNEIKTQNEELVNIFNTDYNKKINTPTDTLPETKVPEDITETPEPTLPKGVTATPKPTPPENITSVITPTKSPDDPEPAAQFERLLQLNKDTAGWIMITNKKTQENLITLPVVQHDDNEYYLTHDFYGKKKKHGMIFMDYRNSLDPLSKNTILYGHNMLDGTMFSSLTKYKNVDFANQYPVISFMTIYEEYQWKVFAAHVTNTADENYYLITDFKNDSDFEAYISKAKSHSNLIFDVDVTKDDKILTLSTCTNVDKAERYVVYARLVRSGESLSVGTAKKNPSPQPLYNTLTPKPTYAPTPTKTPVPTPVNTITPTPLPTNTEAPTKALTPTETLTPTPNIKPTFTPTPTLPPITLTPTQTELP